jgi:hypothetical protein
MKPNLRLTETLKIAEPDDVKTLEPLLLAFFKMSPYQDLNLDLGKCLRNLMSMCIDRKNSIVLLSMEGDKIVGLIAGTKILPVFSSDPVALELAWFVYPEYRKSPRGIELLDGYEEWAKLVGCKASQFSLLASVDPEDTDVSKLFKMRGFKHTEQMFQRSY